MIVNGGTAQQNELAMRLVPGLAVNLLTGEQRAVGELKNVVAMAGIGHPPRFFNTLRQQGVAIAKEVAFADHQNYSADTLNTLTMPEQTLLMTEKDAVKAKSFASAHWWYLPVDAVLPSEQSAALLNKISALIPR